MKALSTYLPKEEELVLVQARLPKELMEKVRAAKHKDHLSWHTLIESLFKLYLDERQVKPKT